MIVAMPLDAGLSQAFAASLQRPHADVYVSWVQMYQEGKLANKVRGDF